MSLIDLKKAKIDDYPLFSFENLITKGKVVHNYDGDTVDLLFINNSNIIHVKARLFGYDSPEMKVSKSDPDRESKIKKANQAKDKLWELCAKCSFNKSNNYHENILNIWCHEFDKYGRLLVTLFEPDIEFNNNNFDEAFKLSINFKMIQDGNGYPYYGGTKNK